MSATIPAGHVTPEHEILLDGHWTRVAAIKRSKRVAANLLILADGTRLAAAIDAPMTARIPA